LLEIAANNADAFHRESRNINGIAVGLDQNRTSAINVYPSLFMHSGVLAFQLNSSIKLQPTTMGD